MKRGALWPWLLALTACSATCGAPEELAELAARAGGEVEHDQAAAPGQWQSVRIGTRFGVGDGLRTGAQSSAELLLFPSGTAHVAPHSLVRFLAAEPTHPSRQVALEAGEVEVRAEQIDLEIHTPRAVVQVSRGSKMKLSMHDGRERFDLLVGRVTVAHAGVSRALEAAQPLELSAEPVGLTPTQPSTGADSSVDAGATLLDASLDADAALSDAALASLDDAGKRTITAASTGSALRLRAIESATLHVSEAPVDVFFPTADCVGPSRLRIDGQTLSVMDEGATAQLGFGVHRLRVTCAPVGSREVRLSVKRDAARLELPKRAQRVRVEADGRRYTVRYQNLLPDLTLVWPGETAAGSFTLVVRTGKHELTRTLDRPEHVLSGATVGEGEHKFWFHDASGHTSKPTTLRLAFDNTARSAYLSLPLEGSTVNEATVAVEGAALVSSKVTVQDRPAKLDEQGRFYERAELGPDQSAVSVRVEHPGSGVHYYLRRLR